MGSSQRTVAAGASIAASQSMGYRTPTVGGWLRGQAGPVRVIGEVDNSRKAWMPDGYSWRVRGSVDGPQWRGLAPVGVVGVHQHRNLQWAKGGAWYGGGVRWRGVYSWYSPADSSPNRSRAWLLGWEFRHGRLALSQEFERRWWEPGAAGFAVVGRVGYTF